MANLGNFSFRPIATPEAFAHNERVRPWELRFAGIALGVGLLTGCSREDSARSIPEATPSITNAPVIPVADDFAASLPHLGGLPGYVGSAACQRCHEDQFSSWHRTYHRTMTQFATPETVRANFEHQTLTNHGVRFHLTRADQEFLVRMERMEEPASPDDPPALLDTRISLVTGSHHMQVFWVPGGDGNMQVGFPFTWLIPEQRWVPRNSTFIRPPGFKHQAEVWNVICSRCHATGVEPRVDNARHLMDSRLADLGIACEACHGPGERHTLARNAAGLNAPQPDAALLRQEIVQPQKLDAVRASEICGFCHSMKWIDQSEGWRQHGFRYRPGDNLEATTPLILPRRVDSIPGLKEYLAKNPALLDDYFWNDGMGRVSGREFNGLVESPCFRGGKFSCLSCHSLHESDPDDLLAKHRTDSQACLQCHEAYREPAAQARHTHHRTDSTGNDCYNCHMPHTTYGVLSAIRSHQVSSPRVADQLVTGRPNACNLCHLDQTLSWTAQRLAEWYQQPVPPLEESMRTVADSVRLTLAGDAGQRALMAWHFGWAPARQTAGTNWISPVLGVLLDDPYAAIRCVASRSLRATSELEPIGYDFVIEPSERDSAAAQVWTAWSQKMPSAAKLPAIPKDVLVKPGTAADIKAQLAPMIEQRNQRPMRLRE